MQRRTARAQAHISPPPSARMGSDNEKHHRFSNRSVFGVTNRIWLILVFVIFVLGFTSYILPSSSSYSTPLYSTANLKSKNYLNTTEMEENPFEFCPVYGPGDAIGAKYGSMKLAQSRLHLGSSGRIQRVISRALAGQPVTISVIGGSVSACHGSGDDPISSKCYPSKFFQWWNSVFPHPASELTNGAIRRTTSDYFGFCSMHHIPDVTDLIIVEMDVHDIPDATSTDNFETLIRSLLLRPSNPAVILLNHFAPQIHEAHGFFGPDHWHSSVAQFYDVPYLSTKPLLFNSYLEDASSLQKYYVDPVLASEEGHELLKDVLVSYVESEICKAWNIWTGSSYDGVPGRGGSNPNAAAGIAPGGGGAGGGLFGGMGQRKGVVPEEGGGEKDVDAEGNRIKVELPENSKTRVPQLHVPPARMNTKVSQLVDRPYEEIAPFCVSANDLINPLPPSIFYGSGWNAYHPKTAGGGSVGGGRVGDTKAHYWYSTLPTSKLRIPINVGAGDISIYYLVEPEKDIGEGSSVSCWVDDNVGGSKVLFNSAADIREAEPTLLDSLFTIDHYVSRGPHFVECQLNGEEGTGVPPFKIIGIFST
ncbi:hypothetical protein K435DRAFT_378757 [Dendrothele bispora CBS 962.96]|uniref:Capsular associated protein n=1 Tax=Dendrothele bispora (strain CBS 962.96) TaxID=1314807 RepID=A0A4S8LB83_DENBC|nr:hypothetical protein K435DRAFT_378757 [Dendrothele bispora CBS 962.96]